MQECDLVFGRVFRAESGPNRPFRETCNSLYPVAAWRFLETKPQSTTSQKPSTNRGRSFL